MIKLDEEALVCDLAETYHILDYRQLPADLVAVFSAGLREDARIKLKMRGQRLSLDHFFLAGILDRLSLLLWMNTKDGQKGRNRPKLTLDSVFDKQNKRELSFASGEEFEKRRAELLAKFGGEN